MDAFLALPESVKVSIIVQFLDADAFSRLNLSVCNKKLAQLFLKFLKHSYVNINSLTKLDTHGYVDSVDLRRIIVGSVDGESGLIFVYAINFVFDSTFNDLDNISIIAANNRYLRSLALSDINGVTLLDDLLKSFSYLQYLNHLHITNCSAIQELSTMEIDDLFVAISANCLQIQSVNIDLTKVTSSQINRLQHLCPTLREIIMNTNTTKANQLLMDKLVIALHTEHVVFVNKLYLKQDTKPILTISFLSSDLNYKLDWLEMCKDTDFIIGCEVIRENVNNSEYFRTVAVDIATEVLLKNNSKNPDSQFYTTSIIYMFTVKIWLQTESVFQFDDYLQRIAQAHPYLIALKAINLWVLCDYSISWCFHRCPFVHTLHLSECSKARYWQFDKRSITTLKYCLNCLEHFTFNSHNNSWMTDDIFALIKYCKQLKTVNFDRCVNIDTKRIQYELDCRNGILERSIWSTVSMYVYNWWNEDNEGGDGV